jgi:recombinational DNA repair protein (RecF pathway)
MKQCAICKTTDRNKLGVLATHVDEQLICSECRREAEKQAKAENRNWLPEYFETLRRWLDKT